MTETATPSAPLGRALAAAAAITAVAVVPTAASAQASPPPPTSIDVLCAEVPAEDAFDDVGDDDTWAAAVRCLSYAGITAGVTADQYAPARSVNRQQMASFIARTMDVAVVLEVDDDPSSEVTPLPRYDGENRFGDVSARSPHLESVNRLAAAGIALGGPAGLPDDAFGPDRPVTRGQMASFISRALEHLTGVGRTADDDHFADDDGSLHEDNIDALAAVGVVAGYGDRTYRPGAAVERGSMALFLTRPLANLEAGDVIGPLPDRPAFPPARTNLAHGGETWAAVLAGSKDWDDPALDTAQDAATRAGYRTGATDCDDGAPEALGLDPSAATVSVYFEREDQARAAAEAFRAWGVEDAVEAQVRTYCLD